jgi:hypothetical protein
MNRPSLIVPAGIPPNHKKIATTNCIRLLIPIKDLREVYRSPRGKPRHYSKGSNRNSGRRRRHGSNRFEHGSPKSESCDQDRGSDERPFRPRNTTIFSEGSMITDDATKQAVYQSILKTAQKRLEQAVPGSTEGAFAHLSLAAVLNLLFLLRGEWGSIGDYVTTQRALRTLIGDDLLWAEQQKAAPASLELVH